jgi:hypothetical protein
MDFWGSRPENWFHMTLHPATAEVQPDCFTIGSFAWNRAVQPLGVLRFAEWKLLFGEESAGIILSNSAQVKSQLYFSVIAAAILIGAWKTQISLA